MNAAYEATIIKNNCSQEVQEQIITLFSTEDKDISKGRAQYTITKENNTIVFSITSQDATALRAVTTAITKTLSIFEKMSNLQKNQ